MTRPFSPFRAWVTVPSPSGSLFYSKATWWAHVPEGPSTQRFTFSTATYCLGPRRSDKESWQREGVILPGGERDLVVGYLAVSRGFVGILCGFVISSIWELGGYSRGILRSGCGGTDLAGKWKKVKKKINVHLICAPERRVGYSCVVWIRISVLFFFSCAFQSETVTVWQMVCWRWSYFHVKKTDLRVKQAPTMDP